MRTKRALMQFADNEVPDQMRILIRAVIAHLQKTFDIDIVVYVNEQRMSRLGCEHAHTHLDLRCSHMA